MLKKKSSGAAKSGTKKKGKGGVSLDDDDAIDVGLFSSGPAVIKESIFAEYDYGGNAKPTPVWLITYGRDGEEDYEQPYSLGKGWKVSEDGKELIAKAGQTGLPKSCNAIRHLIKPLKAALAENSDIEIDLASGDPSVLDGLEVVLRRVDQEERDIRDKGGKSRKRDESKGPRTILEIEEVTGTEGDTSASTVKKKAKKKPVDDDEEDEDQDDEDEAPAKKKPTKGRGKPAADEEDEDEEEEEDESDDDEEDEKPKAKAKAKGKAKPDEDDDEEESNDDDDDEYDAREDAIETIIEVVSDGDVPLSKLEGKLTKFLKGNKHADEIIAWATSTKNLKTQKGWTFDGKVVSADE